MKSFTLIELLIVISVMVIVIAAGVPLYGNLQVTSQLNENTNQIIQTIRTAHQRSVSRVNDSSHGVRFEINPSSNDQYILYQGSSYSTRDSSYDRTVTLDSPLHIATTLSGNEVNFSRSLGTPNTTGSIVLSHDTTGTRAISINSFGIVEEVVPESEVTLYAGRDSYMRQGVPSTNYGTDAQIQEYPRNIGYNRRGLIWFDLSSIPGGATINSATLYLYEAQTYGLARTVAIHRLTQGWTESGVTWASYDGTNSWTLSGGDYDTTPTATAVITWTGALKWDSWDVTAGVGEFINNTYSNYGWLIKDNTEDTSEAYWFFASREVTNQPYLVVNYSL
ncbi:DNRLRE domain-containing protein [Patescibacteria group bacterium AH-259-L05]|nr:DNRLRE domain-containing protein [Patescibacteria group bacterium AH-259-L05]